MFKRLFLGVALISLLGTAFARYEGSTGAHASNPLAAMHASTTNIHLGLLENDYESSTQDEVGKVDVVWAAENTWKPANNPAPGVAHMFYDYFARDSQESSHHNYAWMQANHPDWIEYACDRTTGLNGNGWTGLDFTNPAVRDYQVGIIEQAMDNGYNGVDFDVTDTFNYSGYCGHYDANGNWVQQFSGQTVDPAYRQAYISSFAAFTQQIRNAAASRGISFTIGINPALDNWKPSNQVEDLFPYVDLVLDEAGFTLGGWNSSQNKLLSIKSDFETSQWGEHMKWLQDLVNAGKAVIIAGNENYTVDQSHAPAPGDSNWVLANYLLVKGDHTYQAPMTTAYHYGGVYYWVPGYGAQVGTPTDSMYAWSGVYRRDFSNGMSLVNPSSSQGVTITVPAGNWQDLQGHAVTGSITLPAGGSGTVLVGTASAASTATPTTVPTTTSTPVPTATRTPVPTTTSTPAPTSTPIPTNTPAPTSTPWPTATSTPAPTQTPAPTSTPWPTATSTPIPTIPPAPIRSASSLVVNGGFESGGAGWNGSPVYAQYLVGGARPHSGALGAELCGSVSCNQRLMQTFTVPAGLTAATLDYWVYIDNPGQSTCSSALVASVSVAGGRAITAPTVRCLTSGMNHWIHVTADMSALSAAQGQTVTLGFWASTGPTTDRIFLDDVSLAVSSGGTLLRR